MSIATLHIVLSDNILQQDVLPDIEKDILSVHIHKNEYDCYLNGNPQIW